MLYNQNLHLYSYILFIIILVSTSIILDVVFTKYKLKIKMWFGYQLLLSICVAAFIGLMIRILVPSKYKWSVSIFFYVLLLSIFINIFDN